MNVALAIVLLVAVQRLAELIHGERNARRLLAAGAQQIFQICILNLIFLIERTVHLFLREF